MPPEELETALARFRGEIEQLPPMYSAIKVKGRKLYEIARKGGEVERKTRTITIKTLEVTGKVGDEYSLRVVCSKGTYVRTLCHDIGAALGCGGCMSALRRTRAGDFHLDDACMLSDVQQAADCGKAGDLLLPTDTLFRQHPACSVTTAGEKDLRNGKELPLDRADGLWRIYGPKGDFLALCRSEGGRMKTVKSFFEVEKQP